ncbi:helix-turn-helix transcriptional regulator [Streptosporangium roseum]|uniref:helix-turn-helix transcriptional regulator n=1 Tax=Streptosporangium roseum TaxID=2001 RepID=UPI002F35D1FA
MEPLELLECSPPLAREPLNAEQAAGVAQVFKALGDPVRLRILSIVASHASRRSACSPPSGAPPGCTTAWSRRRCRSCRPC